MKRQCTAKTVAIIASTANRHYETQPLSAKHLGRMNVCHARIFFRTVAQKQKQEYNTAPFFARLAGFIKSTRSSEDSDDIEDELLRHMHVGIK